jgi:N-acetylmuramic acid 6-phosphate etherase
MRTASDLDRLPPAGVVRRILDADATVAEAVARVEADLVRAVELAGARFQAGGDVLYVGAGTSGRLAHLDAAELPPTYGTHPRRVRVLMAGGEEAFLRAVEGAEDDEDAARSAVASEARPEDVVVGIAASGSTPYTVAAVEAARELGAATVGIACRRGSRLADAADVAIEVETGDEVIRGSTRMKAGTAQKMVLNAFSTAVMVTTGRVYRDLMVDMPPTNRKLRRRAIAMVAEVADVDDDRASAALDRADGEVKTAIVALLLDLDARAARRRLAASDGRLRTVLEADP